MSFSPTFRRKLRKILFKGLEEEEYVIYNNITTLKRERERERERGQSYALPYVPGEDDASPLLLAPATWW